MTSGDDDPAIRGSEGGLFSKHVFFFFWGGGSRCDDRKVELTSDDYSDLFGSFLIGYTR